MNRRNADSKKKEKKKERTNLVGDSEEKHMSGFRCTDTKKRMKIAAKKISTLFRNSQTNFASFFRSNLAVH